MILVFGGEGQLGSELARAAAASEIPLRALSRTTADIADAEAVGRALSAVMPTLVVNTAAYTDVDLAEKEIDAAERTNAYGPTVVAEACAAAAVPLVHISTDYVFDGLKKGSYSESDPVAPLCVYGRTKAAGEEAVRTRLARHIILRTAWVYGEFGDNFLKRIVRLAQEREELRVVDDQKGCPTSTRDLAAAILLMAPRLIAGDEVWGTYHFAGCEATTWHGFAERIVAAQAPLTGRQVRVKAMGTIHHPTPARRPANSCLDCNRFANVFGHRARLWTEEADEITVAVVKALQRDQTHYAT